MPIVTDPFTGELPSDPLAWFQNWLDEAVEKLAPQNPTAMTLATVDASGAPAARMVICRGFDAEAGWLVLYTDRTSAKAREITKLKRAALVFYWDALQRSVRIEGPVSDAPDAQSDAYFASRPVSAQLAAWASDQSAPLDSRADLERRYAQVRARFGVENDVGGPGEVPRPENWGGYRVWVEHIEFWAGRPSRMHDRARYERTLSAADDGFTGTSWRAARLQP